MLPTEYSGLLCRAAVRRLGQRQAHCKQIVRGHAGRHLSPREEIHAPHAEKILLFFTGKAHWWFSLCRHGQPPAMANLQFLAARRETGNARARSQTSFHHLRHHKEML
ncbi:MAG TPA: hypothetical protein VEW06_07200, partial [Xanthobacteraceae bacterium]|nr:hypothetical protein [Xanthobacteraceae bacterium]